MNNIDLTRMLGISMTVISTEHFMSAGLSSPWSVKKFAETDEDKEDVWHYFWEAAVVSFIFAGFIFYMLNDYWILISSMLMIGYYYYLYKDAMNGS